MSPTRPHELADPNRQEGTIVRRVEGRGFGFIRNPVTNEEFFFHATELENCEFPNLRDGDRVSFLGLASPKGPRAEQIRKLE